MEEPRKSPCSKNPMVVVIGRFISVKGAAKVARRVAMRSLDLLLIVSAYCLSFCVSVTCSGAGREKTSFGVLASKETGF